MQKTIKIKLYFVFAFLFLSALGIKTGLAQGANGVELTPYFIDEKVDAGDKLEFKLHFKNNSAHKVRMYAIVNDLTSDGGRQEFKDPHYLDKTTSLARWIRITRNNIEFMPDEEGDIDLQIMVNNAAVPGKRFASIAFPQGANPKIAEAGMAQKSYPELRINVEVKDKNITKAQIERFSATKKLFLSSQIEFNIGLKNLGTTDINLQGEIIIYNRRGTEIGKIDAGEQIGRIKAGQKVDKKIFWQRNKGIGRLKARMELEYGKKDKRDLMDTTFFWALPWALLLLYGGILFLILVFMIIFLFKRTYKSVHQTGQYYKQQKGKDEYGVINLKK